MKYLVPMLAGFVLANSLVAVQATAQQTGKPPKTSAPAPKSPSSPSSSATSKSSHRQTSEDLMWLDAERLRQLAGQFKDFESLRNLEALQAFKFDQHAFAPLAAELETKAMALNGEHAALSGHLSGLNGQQMALNARALVEQAKADAMMAGAGVKGQFGFGFSDAPMAFTKSGGSFRTQAPASWDSQDAADSLYREARKALSNDSNRRAAELFRRIRDSYPRSTYTPDAPYWEAFALQRLGSKDELLNARELLALQKDKYPRASTRSDASALRARIEGQLARLGDQSAIASLADQARNATSDGCPREQDDERIDALNALAQMDAEQSLPILKKVLARREPCTQRLRRQAVWLVASRKHADAATILLNVAKTDPDKEVREQAIFWISNVPTEEATTMLIDLVKKGDDLDLRKRAIYSLSRSKSPRAAATLKEVALDAKEDEELRADALQWYLSGPGRTADDSFTFLKEVYGRADDQQLKQRIVSIMAQRRSDESRTFLIDLAQNQKESMDTRRTAVWALQGSGVTGAQLTGIYDRNADIEMRRMLIGVMLGLKDNSGIDKLLDIARNEKNIELRKTALTYLSRSKDPRVAQLLQEIIDR